MASKPSKSQSTLLTVGQLINSVCEQKQGARTVLFFHKRVPTTLLLGWGPLLLEWRPSLLSCLGLSPLKHQPLSFRFHNLELKRAATKQPPRMQNAQHNQEFLRRRTEVSTQFT